MTPDVTNPADLDELERLCEGATPGAWAADSDGCITKAEDGWSFIPMASAFVEGAFYRDAQAQANAAFIAALNPQTAKALIQRARLCGEIEEALREAEAVMAKNVYPQPDKPDSAWGVLLRVRQALSLGASE